MGLANRQKILIINNTLDLGGGEKLLVELCKFAIKNNIEPEVLIVNNLNEEFYDRILGNMNVKVFRKNLITRKKLFLSIFDRFFFYNVKLRYLLNKNYAKVHFLNLATNSHASQFFNHKKKFFWHIGNNVQYPKQITPCLQSVLYDEDNTIVCINDYQVNELIEQFGNVDCKIVRFDLFLN